MKRVLVGILTTMLCIGLMASVAEAGGKKKKKRSKKKGAPMSEKIQESMGELKWGMTKDELMKKMLDKVKAEYRPLIAKTHDAVEEDRLRVEAKQKMAAIRKGFVRFEGRTTGWDVSFLKGEFTHNNDESMLVQRDRNSQNFYFFIGDRLWKWYKAFDANVFPANNFNAFAAGVQRRFGEAKDMNAELRSGEGARHWLEWQDKNTRLRAIDQTDFYGFYCLVFEDKNTVDRLASLRSNKSDSGPKQHALVEAVTSGDEADPDESPNIVDRITGRIRQNEQAEPSSSSSSGRSKRSTKSSSASSTRPTGVSESDDPLSGLGL